MKATISQHIRDFQQKLKLEGQMSKKDWAFWNTQPVPKLDEVFSKIFQIYVNIIFQDITDQNMGPIEPSRDNVRQEPYTLPKGFEWDTMDVS